MNREVCWHEAPVSLHIAVEAAHSTGSIRDDQHSSSSTAGRHRHRLTSSLPFDATSAQQILFFAAEGAFVHAAPLHITVAEAKSTHSGTSKAAMVNVVAGAVETTTEESIMATEGPSAAASFALPPALSADTTKGVAAEMTIAEATGKDEEWTDAVDEEAMAFFNDE
ncbi:hypothetical protein LDHU3_31.5000:CDS1 [Leishmania donovani]|uniref:Hypothetical_protein n=2 Tax=Leishmania donovani species complex TaxID=38574 RepID=A0A6L0XMG0_LEIIN|nr:hypothetical protein LdCL_310037000 [Leishmania donovani]CAC9521331.1 hypothetical_protein [Leishmania infantum]TPP41342.1 hypothetical protein CGC20_2760 [Leishmania donovani]TPP42486.1 hypothetical protein CGC21_10855 [Leishmania donovani]CAJ1991485.1 hypothetical protein LDHU3_31.5000:CDS1 [Leishmania donovani]